MSALVSGLVWTCDIPRPAKIVLLAYADHAEPDGGRIWPSLDLIAWKTGYNWRQCKRITDELLKAGLLILEDQREGRTKLYRIPVDDLPVRKWVSNRPGRPRKTPDISALTPDILGKTPDTAMSAEPPIEPSGNQKNIPTRVRGMPEDGWDIEDVKAAAAAPTCGFEEGLIQAYFDARTAVGWVDGAGRAVARTLAALQADMRRWKVNEPNHRAKVVAADGKDDTTREWKTAYDAACDAVWRVKEGADKGDPEAMRKAIRAVRDKFRDAPKSQGRDAVSAGVEKALNNQRPK